MSIRHHKQIRAVKGWIIEEFNGGVHVRINGVVDVWPDVRKYMPSGSRAKARTYLGLPELKRIVSDAERMKPRTEVDANPKRAIKPMTQEEWARRFA